AIGFLGVRLPAIVVEILLGIVVGPQLLGWASNDEPVQVLSLIGLAFLLLLAGLEIDFDRLRGRLLRITALGYAVSFGLALVVGFGLRAGDLVRSPLLVAIILSATGLGIVLPILKDARQSATPFGQVIVAGASIAEVAPIVLLSLFFSGKSGGIGAKLVLLIGFGVFIPFFFVATGIKLDVASLFHSTAALMRVPLFLAAMLVVRGLPAVLYRPLAERTGQLVAGGLLQATSLSIPVVAGQIGVDLGLIRPTNYVALVTAGLISVIVFPLVALTLLRGRTAPAAAADGLPRHA